MYYDWSSCNKKIIYLTSDKMVLRLDQGTILLCVVIDSIIKIHTSCRYLMSHVFRSISGKVYFWINSVTCNQRMRQWYLFLLTEALKGHPILCILWSMLHLSQRQPPASGHLYLLVRINPTYNHWYDLAKCIKEHYVVSKLKPALPISRLITVNYNSMNMDREEKLIYYCK